jgi:4-alpha-glucanotransferase
MKFPRSSGILLHPTSLSGPSGIGDLGAGAYAFADFLSAARQHLWQVLPLGPTGYGDSPYQCFSAFAGNPLLISLEKLAEEGILSAGDLAINHLLRTMRWIMDRHSICCLLRKAFENFKQGATPSDWNEFHAFCRQHMTWLDDYATFTAIKEAHGGTVWSQWDPAIASRRPKAIMQWTEKLSEEIESCKYAQYQFFKQWSGLKTYCHERNRISAMSLFSWLMTALTFGLIPSI